MECIRCIARSNESCNQGDWPRDGKLLARIPTILKLTAELVRQMEANARVSVEEEVACVAPAGGDAAAERLRVKLVEIIKAVDRGHLVPPMAVPVRLSVKVNW